MPLELQRVPPQSGLGARGLGDGTYGDPIPLPGDRGALLLTGSAPEVLARIVPDDPLGLRSLIGQKLAARALLLDPEALLLRTQAACALLASSWRGEPELARWLERRVEEAFEGILAEEREALERGELAGVGDLPGASVALGEACARFNAMPFEWREAFVALVLDRSNPDRAARARGLSLSELARRARAGVELFRRGALLEARGLE